MGWECPTGWVLTAKLQYLLPRTNTMECSKHVMGLNSFDLHGANTEEEREGLKGLHRAGAEAY